MTRLLAPGQESVDRDTYRQDASAWVPGAPFPVPGREPDPGVRVDPRPGRVLSLGGPDSRAAGALLARATERPHRHLDAAAAAAALRRPDGPVALVATAADLDLLRDWDVPADAEVGVVTARGPAALGALVHRTVVAPSWSPGPVRRMVHPTFPTADRADAVELDELREVTAAGSGLLLLQSHGRECCVHLPDAVVCGRSGPVEPRPVPPGVRAPACMTGAGCIRRDLPAEGRVPAAELRARIVVVHSCFSAAPAVHALPDDAGLALGALDGDAVAVVAAIGMHVAELATADELVELVAAGHRLGAVVAALNRRAAGRGGTLSRFVLLGDPGLLPRTFIAAPATGPGTADAAPATGPGTADTAPATGPGTVVTTPAAAADPWGPDGPVVAALRHAVSDVLPALDQLRWLGVPVPDLTAVAGQAAAAWAAYLDGRPVDTAVAALSVALEAVQVALVGDLLREAYETWWEFGGRPAALREVAADPVTCPQCGRGSARRISYVHRLDDRLAPRALSCLRCGVLEWSVPAGALPVRQEVPGEVVGTVGGDVPVPAVVTGPAGREVRGAAGFAPVNGDYFGSAPPRAQALAIPAGGTVTLPHALDCRRADLLPDQHELVTVSCLDGALTVSFTQLWLAPPAGSGRPGPAE